MPDDLSKENQGRADPQLEFLDCALTIRFYPPIPLTKTKQAHLFSTELSDLFKTEKTAFTEIVWQFEISVSGHPECRFGIGINNEQLIIGYKAQPKMAEDWIEERIIYILNIFKRLFSPQMVLGIQIASAATLDLQQDTRQFLAEKFMQLQGLHLFGRPIGLIGLRVVFPPFTAQDEDGKPISSDIFCDLKIESLGADQNKLFLASTSAWQDAKQWEQTIPADLIARLQTVKEFQERYVKSFVLAIPPYSDEDI